MSACIFCKSSVDMKSQEIFIFIFSYKKTMLESWWLRARTKFKSRLLSIYFVVVVIVVAILDGTFSWMEVLFSIYFISCIRTYAHKRTYHIKMMWFGTKQVYITKLSILVHSNTQDPRFIVSYILTMFWLFIFLSLSLYLRSCRANKKSNKNQNEKLFLRWISSVYFRMWPI